MYIVCFIEYLGSHTIGWQSQPNDGPSIQSYFTEALKRFTGEDIISIDCAGRTDKGVHALGQVIGFHTQINRISKKWITGLNRYLPLYIRVINIAILNEPAHFHPRYSALSRTYRYYLIRETKSISMLQGLVTPFGYSLNENSLQEAAALIEGEHDFKAFQGGGCQAKSTIKHCYHAKWIFFKNIIVFEVKAKAFLHHMVRYLVGCQLQVGMGLRDINWFKSLLHDQGSQDYCAAPQGLYLAHVEFSPEHSIGWPDKYPWFDPRCQNPS